MPPARPLACTPARYRDRRFGGRIHIDKEAIGGTVRSVGALCTHLYKGLVAAMIQKAQVNLCMCSVQEPGADGTSTGETTGETPGIAGVTSPTGLDAVPGVLMIERNIGIDPACAPTRERT